MDKKADENKDKKADKNKSENSHISDQGLPAWVMIAGAVLLVALSYTSYQMVQRGSEIAGAKKALTTAFGAQAETAKEVAVLKKAAAENKKEASILKKKISDLNNDLAESKSRLGSLKGELETAKAENEKNKMTSQVQDKLAQQNKAAMKEVEAVMKEAETLKKAATGFKDKITGLEKDLTVSKARFGSMQDELKASNSKLSQAMAESKKHKQAALAQEKLAQEYKEKAERATAQ